MAPPEFFTSCFEQACSFEPPKLAFINLSVAASTHCFMTVGGRLRPSNTILTSHWPALRVGRSIARAGAASTRRPAVRASWRRMTWSPSRNACAIVTCRRNDESVPACRRSHHDEIAFGVRRAMHVDRTPEHLLHRVEAVDHAAELDQFSVTETHELCSPVADRTVIHLPHRRQAR